MMFVVSFILVVGLFIYYYLIKPHKYWKDRGVEQTKPIIFFGDFLNLILQKQSGAEFYQHLYNACPGTRYSGMYRFNRPSLVIRDPELIKTITIKDFDYFTDHKDVIDPQIDPLFAKNLFALKGDAWKQMRSILSPVFSSGKIKIVFSLICETADNFVQYFGTPEGISEVELCDAITRYTNDAIATAAFGMKVDSLADPRNEFYLKGISFSASRGFLANLKLIGSFLIPQIYKMLSIQVTNREVNDFFKDIINKNVKEREEKGIFRPDMINVLMDAKKNAQLAEKRNINENNLHDRKDTGKHKRSSVITNEDITAQALIFFFGGFESVATLIKFALYELAINPNIQEKLREEIKQTYEDFNGNLTYESLMNTKYLDMVISETLRKWPPFVVTDRICTKRYTIAATKPGEKPLVIEKGDDLLIPIYGLHRDPNIFPNPDNFDPERFSKEKKGNFHPNSWIPFGLGPRNCIGSRFALLESKVVLFKILNTFKILPTENTVVPLKFSRWFSVNINVESDIWVAFEKL